MKLIQLNMWQGRLLSQALSFLKTEQPDILCLQEVLHADGAIYIPSRMYHSLDLICQTLGYAYRFFAPILHSTVDTVPVAYGNAIVSRYPLQESQTHFIHGELARGQCHSITNTRNLQITSAAVAPGQYLTLVNHHGYLSPDGPLGSTQSTHKLAMVARHIQQLPKPLILTGDLNVTAKSDAMQPLHHLLTNLTQTHGLQSTLSALHHVKDVACDHILVSNDVQLQRFFAHDALVSDHKALVLEFAI